MMEFLDSKNGPAVAAAAGVAVVVGAALLFPRKAPKPTRDRNTVYLHVLKPNKFIGLFSPDVWCLTLETWLRIAGISHETIRSQTAVKYSPNGTLPYIEYNGHYEADHRQITAYLSRVTNTDTEGFLTPQQRATAHVVEQMLERSTIPLLVDYPRLTNTNLLRRQILASLPIPWLPGILLEPFVAVAVFLKKRSSGLDEEERRKKIKADVQALSDLLGTNHFITGAAKPSAADALVYAFLVNTIEATVKDEDMARWMQTINNGNLKQYLARVRETVWKDWWNKQEVLQYRAGS